MKRQLHFILLFIIFSLNSCKKEDTYTAPSNPIPEENFPIYFKANIKNKNIYIGTKTILADDSISSFQSSSFRNFDSLNIVQYCYHRDIDCQKKNYGHKIRISFNNFFKNSELSPGKTYKDKTQYLNTFAPGPRAFIYDFSSRLDGIAISYVDENKNVWSSSVEHETFLQGYYSPFYKVPNFVNHKFTCTSFSDHSYTNNFSTPPQNITELLVKVNFDCYLYNNKGDSLHLKNAEFQSYFSYCCFD